MSYPFAYPLPQNADVQIFAEGGSTGDWLKPQNKSFVWFTLIGPGGGGAAGDNMVSGGGGGSGAVTNCMVPAFLVPDMLIVTPGLGGAGAGGTATGTTGPKSSIKWTTYELLSANGGVGGRYISSLAGSGGAASLSNAFSAVGFFQSIAGQNGGSAGPLAASATTFLNGGGGAGGGGADTVTSNYGYGTTVINNNVGGDFFLQPILVGRPSSANFNATASVQSGIGCGGAGIADINGTAYPGGDGLVVIISW